MAARKKKTTRRRPSLRKAIDNMCKSCIYDPHEPGGWRQQVTACTSPSCPLFNVRPTVTEVKKK